MSGCHYHPTLRVVFVQVSFRTWVQGAVCDVVAMYEDRHEVVVVGPAATLLRQSVPFKRTKVRGGPLRIRLYRVVVPGSCAQMLCSQSMQEHKKWRNDARVCVTALGHMV